LNVNVPDVPLSQIRGIRFTRQDPAPYDTHVETRYDKWGVPYYWIGGNRLETPNRDNTDYAVTQENYVSITPLHTDMTDYTMLETLGDWGITVG
jgi:5'-nucleotidase